VFVSYRRRDTAQLVGRLSDQLKAYYGSENIFLDTADLPYGVDYREPVQAALSRSDVAVAIIGAAWRGPNGESSRLDEPDDPVRIEIESALEARVPIMPVLVDGTPMPAASQVPESLRPLIYLNGVPLTSGVNYHTDTDRLIGALNVMLGPKAPIVRRTASLALALRNPIVWALALVFVLPFVAAALGIAPPWPPGIQIVTVAIEALTIVTFLVVVRSLDRASLKRYLFASAACLALCGGGFLVAQSAFVFAAPTTGQRFVKGFVCTDDARLLYKSKCPFLGDDELQGTEYDAERLWTVQSIAATRVALDALWLLAFVAVSVLSAFAIVYVLHEETTQHAARFS
jgi:hypothetical protein